MTRSRSSPAILRFHGHRPSPRGRLICIPHAGVGAAAFREFHSFLPGTVDVCSIRLPGRESRIDEPALTSVAAIADLLLDELQLELDAPYALVGQCLGALVAFEFACRLSRHNARQPEYMFLLSQAAPPEIRGSDAEAFDEFLNNALKDTFPDRSGPGIASMIKIMTPTIHADYSAAHRYYADSTARLATPVSAFLGDQDKQVQPEDMLRWRARTNSSFTLRVIPGSHILSETSLGAIGRHIVQDWLDC
jgi:medium-chain acyl-[acyl-carrier-protein] hydrolase